MLFDKSEINLDFWMCESVFISIRNLRGRCRKSQIVFHSIFLMSRRNKDVKFVAFFRTVGFPKHHRCWHKRCVYVGDQSSFVYIHTVGWWHNMYLSKLDKQEMNAFRTEEVAHSFIFHNKSDTIKPCQFL